MKKKHNKTKYQTYGKRKIHKKQAGKILISSAVASTLVFQPFVPVIQNGQVVGFTENYADAVELADVNLLTEERLDTIQNDANPYNFSMSLSGTGVANVELVDPQTVAVFNAPDLAGNLSINQPAQVTVSILPINPDNLPELGNLVGGITSDLVSAVEPLVSTVDGILNNPLTSGLISVSGLDELEDAVSALNNLDDALADLAQYNQEVDAVLNADGTITVDFTAGLGEYLETAVNEVVVGLLRDVSSAIGSLNIEVLGGALEIPLSPVEILLTPVNNLIEQLSTEVTNLTSGLASAQVLGDTTVTVNATIDENTDAAGVVPISGAVVGTNVIDVELLNTLQTAGSITLPADSEAPAAPVVDPVDSEATEVTGTAEPNADITVTLPSGDTATGTTDGEGNFVVTLPEGTDLVAGEELSVVATDEAGNVSEPTVVTVTEAADQEAPASPVVNPVDTADTEVTGEAEPNSTITVTLPSGTDVTGPTDGAGNFTVALPGDVELAAGDELQVTAADAAGNTSDPAFVTVTAAAPDTEAPAAPTVDSVGEDATEITGEAEPGSEVTVTLPNNEPVTGTTDTDGNFSIDLPEDVELTIGDELTVVATDEAGNPSDPTTVIVADLIAPEAPVLDEVTSEDTTVTGTAEPNSTITVTLPSGDTVTGTTNPEGAFTVELPEDLDLIGGEDLSVTATDEAGNDSNPVTVTIVDSTIPVIEEISDVAVLEGQAIEEIPVEVSEASDVSVEELPDGLVYDEEAGAITGTPTVADWGETEETLDFDVTVTARDEAGNEGTEEFVLSVERDTDGDGIADVEDRDDDNDGVSDEDENDAGTDPKDATDTPEDAERDTTAPVVTAIDDVTAVEGQPIDDIVVETDDETSVVTVDGLPNGLNFDEETNTISGTPNLDDWVEGDEDRPFDVTVTAVDHSGNESDPETFEITIQRDTDGDGDADLVDEDDDNDGISDEDENEAGTNPKDEDSFPDVVAPEAPVVEELTSEDTEVAGTAEPGSEITVTLPNDTVVTGQANEDGEFAIELPEEPVLTGWETIEVVARDEAGNASDPTIITVADRTPPLVLDIENQTVVEGSPIEDIDVVVENPGEVQSAPVAQASTFALIRPFAAPISGVIVPGSDLPEGVTFDQSTNLISGTPVVSDWGETEEERDFEITVVARDEAGNEATETFTITVQRDTDGDRIPDVTDTDDDNDGVSDEDEIATGTDPKDETDTPAPTDTVAPAITPIDDVTAVENTPITDITVEVDEPSLLIATGLPSGIAFDEETGVISGAPVNDDWDVEEEERTFNATITARDAAGNESEETLAFTVQRDTDGDGTPDVTDEDDDNDGATDTEENEAGTDPKDPSDTPSEDTEAPVITPIPDISGEENQPIEDVVVEVNEPSEVVVDGLPSGITYDPETGVISGTPVVDDWAEGETERAYDVTITAEDEAGNANATELSITITRDLADDGTGAPGAGDSDMDNDGTTGDGDDTAGDNQDGEPSDGSNQETLPQTGESQNIWKAFSGSVMAAVGAFMLAWNKKKNAFTKKK